MAKDEKNKKKEQKNSFLKESKTELKKVNWPKPKSLANDTAIVIAIVLIVAIIVFILDFIFLAINENLIIKTEEKIKDSNNTTIIQTIDSENETENFDETEAQEENAAEQTSETTESAQNENIDENSQEESENNEAE